MTETCIRSYEIDAKNESEAEELFYKEHELLNVDFENLSVTRKEYDD